MRRGLTRAWSLAALLGSVNAACAAYRPERAFRTPTIAAPRPVDGTPLSEVWSARPGRGPSAPLARDDSTIYLGGSDRRVVAVDLASGKTRWAVRLGGPLVGGVLRADSLLYAGTDLPGEKIYGMRKSSGGVLWGTRTGGVGAPLTMADGMLIALTRRGDAVGLDPNHGTIRWRRFLGIARAAAVSGDSGTIIVATIDSLFRLRTRTGQVLQRVRAPGVIIAPLVRRGDELVTGSGDSLVMAIDPADLTVRWSVRVDAPILTSPVIRGDTVLAATRVGTVYRISFGSGPEARRVTGLEWPITATPALLGDLLLLGGADGVLRALDPDGSEAWRVRLGRPVETAPLILPDGFLALGGRGDLHRYRL